MTIGGSCFGLPLSLGDGSGVNLPEFPSAARPPGVAIECYQPQTTGAAQTARFSEANASTGSNAAAPLAFAGRVGPTRVAAQWPAAQDNTDDVAQRAADTRNAAGMLRLTAAALAPRPRWRSQSSH